MTIKHIKALLTDPYKKEFNRMQKKQMLKGCPVCTSTMHGVPSNYNDEDCKEEILLWCDDCLVSMDSDGGYTD